MFGMGLGFKVISGKLPDPVYLPSSVSGLYRAWGQVKWIASYSGPCMIGKTAGGASVDVAFGADNIVDKAAAAAASLVTAHQSYEQTGSSDHLTNNGVDARPVIDPSYPLFNFMPMSWGLKDAISPPVQSLQTPTTLSLNRQDMTIVHVYQNHSATNTESIIEGRTLGARSLTASIYAAGQSGIYLSDDGFGFRASGIWSRSNLMTLVIVCNATNINIFMHGVKVATAAYTAATIDQIVLGASGIGAAWTFKGNWGGTAIYNRALSDGEVATVTASVNAMPFGIRTSFPDGREVDLGDSTTAGYCSLVSTTDYMQLLRPGVERINMGCNGETGASGYAARAGREALAYTAGARLVYGYGANDVYAGTTGAVMLTNAQNHISYAKGLGYQLIGRPINRMDGLSAPQQTAYDTYQPAFIANTVGYDRLADVSNTLLLADMVDAVHAKRQGHFKMAPIINAQY